MLYFVRMEYFLGTQRRIFFVMTPEQLALMADRLLRLYISLITFSSHQPAMAFDSFNITVCEPEPEEGFELASIDEFDELPMLRPQVWDHIYLEIDYLREDGASIDSGLCLGLDDLLVGYSAFFEEFFRHTYNTAQRAKYYFPADTHLYLCICRDHFGDEDDEDEVEGLLQAE